MIDSNNIKEEMPRQTMREKRAEQDRQMYRQLGKAMGQPEEQINEAISGHEQMLRDLENRFNTAQEALEGILAQAMESRMWEDVGHISAALEYLDTAHPDNELYAEKEKGAK